MTTIITMHETDAVDTFEVPAGFAERWQNEQVTNEELAAVVDSVYAALTHKQKLVLLKEATRNVMNTVDYLSTKEVNCDIYNVSAKEFLTICINFSLCDYCEEQFA